MTYESRSVMYASPIPKHPNSHKNVTKTQPIMRIYIFLTLITKIAHKNALKRHILQISMTFQN